MLTLTKTCESFLLHEACFISTMFSQIRTKSNITIISIIPFQLLRTNLSLFFLRKKIYLLWKIRNFQTNIFQITNRHMCIQSVYTRRVKPTGIKFDEGALPLHSLGSNERRMPAFFRLSASRISCLLRSPCTRRGSTGEFNPLSLNELLISAPRSSRALGWHKRPRRLYSLLPRYLSPGIYCR